MPFTTRPDADPCPDVPHVRRIMPFIMRTRNESVVYFEQHIDVDEAERFLAESRAKDGVRATLLTLVVFAFARVLHERPRLNRFVAGHRIWQRRGVWISFSAKKAKTDDAPIVVVKRRIEPGASFADVARALDGGISEGRSDRASTTDKELSLAFRLPTFVVGLVVRALFVLDRFGLLPRALIDADPLFASLFIANLGSIGLDAGYHHLYEYGNIPIFAVVGRTEDVLVADGAGGVRTARRATIRYTFDERIEDGLYCVRALERVKQTLEDPRAHVST